jgi:phospholipid/cholesterol/gamma-HCH transport system substrate-binding protein
VRERTVEIIVGLFMLAGILALLALAFKVSGLSTEIDGSKGYLITASFDNIGSLKPRAPVTLAGVRVGKVTNIQLNPVNFKALVTMQIDANQNKLPADTSANIYTQGLLGANYISLSPGFEQTFLKNNDRLVSTHSAIILEDLIGQFLFSIKGQSK